MSEKTSVLLGTAADALQEAAKAFLRKHTDTDPEIVDALESCRGLSGRHGTAWKVIEHMTLARIARDSIDRAGPTERNLANLNRNLFAAVDLMSGDFLAGLERRKGAKQTA